MLLTSNSVSKALHLGQVIHHIATFTLTVSYLSEDKWITSFFLVIFGRNAKLYRLL